MEDRRFDDEIEPVIEDFEADKIRAALDGPGTDEIPTAQVRLTPSARGTAEGPEDEENMYGNDPVGPNLGADLSEETLELDLGTDLIEAEEETGHRPFPDDRV